MGIAQSLASEPVSRLPLRGAILVSSDTIVRAAVAQMRTRKLGCVIVVNALGQPIGVFTERSLIELLAIGKSLDESRVGDYLDNDWLWVHDSDSIDTVFRAIQDRGLRFICVTDQEGKVIGLTGQRGLAEFFADHYPRQVMVQHLSSKPAVATREGA